jgi:hypothetical protein
VRSHLHGRAEDKSAIDAHRHDEENANNAENVNTAKPHVKYPPESGEARRGCDHWAEPHENALRRLTGPNSCLCLRNKMTYRVITNTTRMMNGSICKDTEQGQG